MAKLFSIEDNRAFWETIKRNKFWDMFAGERLREYYYKSQAWYNNYSKVERNKHEWLNFSTLEWEKDMVDYDKLLNINEKQHPNTTG